jgi:hypothetical protein
MSLTQVARGVALRPMVYVISTPAFRTDRRLRRR